MEDESLTELYSIYPLLTGYQYLDKGDYATFRQGKGTVLEFPVFSFLITGNGHKLLVDTGMSDTAHSEKYHHGGRQEPGQAIYEQLEKHGLKPDDIDMILFTHLHWDHCFNLDKFPNARLFADKKEVEFARNPIAFYWASYEYPPATGLTPPFAGRDFCELEGETQVLPGISMFPTPGHSPGHMAVEVKAESGTYVIAGDLMFLRENMRPHPENGWPLNPPGRFCNIIEIWSSMEEVLRRAREDHVLLTHDPFHMDTIEYT